MNANDKLIQREGLEPTDPAEWQDLLAAFKPGDRVRYVPTHVHGDITHEDCLSGVVKSVNDTYVFVNYVRHGILQQTAQGTRPEVLRHD